MGTKVAIITGASRGIGAETAKLFATNGYAVCINYVSNHNDANRIADDISRQGGRCIIRQADVSDEDEVIALFNAVDDELGPVTTLVNNAAILQQQCRLVDMTAARINQILHTNVTASFLCAREAVLRMSTQHGGNGGAIINVSSGAAKRGSPNEYIDYAASKGAIDTFTKGLALEVASEGVRVNAVRPGFIYTQMHAAGGEPNRVDRLAASIPLRRGGLPSEVAEAILWLASDKASYATGSIVDLTGGA